MPKRKDISSILIIGAGPIIIGQACEFDYSGAQACKALKEEGFRVILVNSNPATIMTDPLLADATYIEPIHWESVEKIIEKEKPDAILPTMGGQTALNTALTLDKKGVLKKHNVILIGANRTAIDKAEDRQLFDETMQSINLETPASGIAHSMSDALEVQEKIGFPCIIRPSFTMGGTGGGIAYNISEFKSICEKGLELSPTNELLIDESLIGWKEYEMEVVRDCEDNCIIVCSIENLDPMGIHTGDSTTIAPAQTLTDKEYQIMRNASFKILREIGVDTGGSNVQFAINPDNGKMVVIEMNPRVSRSSALASKATGFPIAKVAALLSVGYTLDELKNDITGGLTPASFEPSIDYIVTKIPKFAFEKFPQASPKLTTQMKSVGEVMSIGSNFQESFQKALCSMEEGLNGLNSLRNNGSFPSDDEIKSELTIPGPKRIFYVADAMRKGWDLNKIYSLTKIDYWFLDQIKELIDIEDELKETNISNLSKEYLQNVKEKGFSDNRIAELLDTNESKIRQIRKNPETVSTDYDVSNRLYFEPITAEKILDIIDIEKPEGVVIQFGGQTPLKLADVLSENGVNILGTNVDAIDRSEDRERFQELVNKLNLKQPSNATAKNVEEALVKADEIGFPIVVRPSYVLGGRAMQLVNNLKELNQYLNEAVEVSNSKPILLDSYLTDAIEVDVDVVSDGKNIEIGGILQHIEQAGIHSGDSACSLPPYSLSSTVQEIMKEQAIDIAKELEVIGLMNIQYAVKDENVFIIEVNPRASRTVPFISKAIGHSLAKVASKAMIGKSLIQQKFSSKLPKDLSFVKEAVMPFDKFPHVDPILGPEMKSTGEVMGIGPNFGEAYAKAQKGANKILRRSGVVFISVKASDKKYLDKFVPEIINAGFEIVATSGTSKYIQKLGFNVKTINKVTEGRPHIVDSLLNNDIDLVINTTEGSQSIEDSASIRQSALRNKIFCTTTMFGAFAIIDAFKSKEENWTYSTLQEINN